MLMPCSSTSVGRGMRPLFKSMLPISWLSCFHWVWKRDHHVKQVNLEILHENTWWNSALFSAYTRNNIPRFGWVDSCSLTSLKANISMFQCFIKKYTYLFKKICVEYHILIFESHSGALHQVFKTTRAHVTWATDQCSSMTSCPPKHFCVEARNTYLPRPNSKHIGKKWSKTWFTSLKSLSLVPQNRTT